MAGMLESVLAQPIDNIAKTVLLNKYLRPHVGVPDTRRNFRCPPSPTGRATFRDRPTRHTAWIGSRHDTQNHRHHPDAVHGHGVDHLVAPRRLRARPARKPRLVDQRHQDRPRSHCGQGGLIRAFLSFCPEDGGGDSQRHPLSCLHRQQPLRSQVAEERAPRPAALRGLLQGQSGPERCRAGAAEPVGVVRGRVVHSQAPVRSSADWVGSSCLASILGADPQREAHGGVPFSPRHHRLAWQCRSGER
mgnify:CR=1 FL=1